jgi:hypothetical protein
MLQQFNRGLYTLGGVLVSNMEASQTNPQFARSVKRPRAKRTYSIASLVLVIIAAGILLGLHYSKKETNIMYKDSHISFGYPSTWKVTRQKTYDSPGGLAISMQSSPSKSTLSDGTKTNFKLDASIFIKKKDAPIIPCFGCTVLKDQQITLTNPKGPFYLIFGSDPKLYGPATVVNVSDKELKVGTKTYTPYIALTNGNRLYIRGLMSYEGKGQNLWATRLDLFINSPAYKKFEQSLQTFDISNI